KTWRLPRHQNRGILHEMEPPKSLAVATFSASEAEAITGVSQATQRDWRRREMTPYDTRKGRKRFTSYDLAHLTVMHQLIPHLRPAVAYRAARFSCAQPILMLAQRAFPSSRIILDGEELNFSNNRFVVYLRFMDGASIAWFMTSDLSTIPHKIE